MKNYFIRAGFAVIFGAVFSSSASAASLVSLLYEKQVGLDRPTINSADLADLELQTLAPIEKKLQIGAKRYELKTQGDRRVSELCVYSSNNTLLRRISLGRGAIQLLPNHDASRLYVLSGGYWGSILEIDTRNDHVLRRLPGGWNPRDLAFGPDGQYLYVLADPIKILKVDSGQWARDIEVPFEWHLDPMADPLKWYQLLPQKDGKILVGSKGSAGPMLYRYEIDTTINGLKKTPRPLALEAKQLDLSKLNMPSTLLPDQPILLSSRNLDYITLLDGANAAPIGLIPLDAPADDFVATPQWKRAYAYHRTINQVSVIDLDATRPTYLSVVARVALSENAPQRLELTYDRDRVYLWDRREAYASIEPDDTNRFIWGYGVGTFGLLPPTEQPQWAMPPVGRFYYLSAGDLLFEWTPPGNTNKAIQRLSLTDHQLARVVLARRGHLLVASEPANNQLLLVDTMTNRLLSKVAMGDEPREVTLSRDGSHAFVLNAKGSTLSVVDLVAMTFKSKFPVDIGFNFQRSFELHDDEKNQKVRITLPTYYRNAAIFGSTF